MQLDPAGLIEQNVKNILTELPRDVALLAAVKGREPEEVKAAISAGVTIIGENYVQEAENLVNSEQWTLLRQGSGGQAENRAKLHFIGHLQNNKVKKAVQIFDMIETVDSLELAGQIDKKCGEINKVMPVLIEVNSGKEEQKFGVLPQKVEPLVIEISSLKNIRVKGLMTMGPFSEKPEVVRPYFIETKKIFDRLKARNITGVEMEILSMGMSGSYRTAIECGANLVRIGTAVFGERGHAR